MSKEDAVSPSGPVQGPCPAAGGSSPLSHQGAILFPELPLTFSFLVVLGIFPAQFSQGRCVPGLPPFLGAPPPPAIASRKHPPVYAGRGETTARWVAPA